MKAVNLEKLLPHDIPAGERILWHGRPRWISLARRAYRADFVVAYFAALTVWNVYSAAATPDGAPPRWWRRKTLGIGAAALALIALLSYLSARTTLYVVTSRRLVMKVGIALPIFINIPFKQIVSASARVYGDGTGDIPVRLTFERADRILGALAARPPVPLCEPRALPALRGQCRRCRRDLEPRASRSRRPARRRDREGDHRAGGPARRRCRPSGTSGGVRRSPMSDLAIKRPPAGMPKAGSARRRRADRATLIGGDRGATDRLRKDPDADAAEPSKPSRYALMISKTVRSLCAGQATGL